MRGKSAKVGFCQLYPRLRQQCCPSELAHFHRVLAHVPSGDYGAQTLLCAMALYQYGYLSYWTIRDQLETDGLVRGLELLINKDWRPVEQPYDTACYALSTMHPAVMSVTRAVIEHHLELDAVRHLPMDDVEGWCLARADKFAALNCLAAED